MAFSSLAKRLGTGATNPLPLVLAGPMLRKVTKSSVTVWVALKQSATVKLTVYAADPAVGAELLTGSRKTVGVGKNLHLAAVTARTSGGHGDLSPGNIYSYDLSFDAGDGATGLATGVGASGKDAYAYPGRSAPCFSLPPDDLEQVRLVQGSCRKPNAEGPDALALLDDMIAAAVESPTGRPHQLLLTGDQIYADEVADVLLLLLIDAAAVLVDAQEPLPGPNDSEFLADMAPPSTRDGRIKDEAKLTTDDRRSHLMSLGEYLAMYLFAWSDVLWPAALPDFSDLAALPGIKDQEAALQNLVSHAAEVTSQAVGVDGFRKTLRKVRRALANVPTAMILDDHDITDDWNLNWSFCNGVYGSPLGRRIVQNGLLAYALCQHWGNCPEQFASSSALGGANPAGFDLLAKFDAKPYAKFAEDTVADVAMIVGVHPPDKLKAQTPDPAVFHDVGARAQTPDGWIDSKSLLYHYTLEANAYQVIVTDTRTWRAFPRGGDTSPPDLIAKAQLATQVRNTPALDGRLLLVVVTTNMPPSPTIRQGARDLPTLVKLDSPSLWFEDFYDSWEIERVDFTRALVEVTRKLPKNTQGVSTGSVVLLSGDVHSSSASRIAYSANAQVGDAAGAPTKAEVTLAQLIGSALHNQSAKTKGQHEKGYTYVPPVYKLGINLARHLTQPVLLTEGFVGWIPATTALHEPVGRIVWDDHFTRGGEQDLVFNPDYCTHTLRDQSLPPLWSSDLAKITKTPDYRLRLDYLKVTDSGGYHKEPPVVEASPTETLKYYDERMRAYDGYVRTQRRGSEIVGLNNIGEISFIRHPNSVVSPLLMVRYMVHWQEDGETKFVWYDVSLDPGDKAFAQPPFPT